MSAKNEAEQPTVQCGRDRNGHVVVGKNKDIVFVFDPHEALLLASALLKQASIVLSGAQLIEMPDNKTDTKQE